METASSEQRPDRLHKHLQSSNLLNRQHISSLGFGDNEERDTKNLRLLFVREVTENIEEYREWMSSTSVALEIECFKNDGHFASEIVTYVQRPVQIFFVSRLLSLQLYQLSFPFHSYQKILSLLHLCIWRTTIQVQGNMTLQKV